MELSGPEKGVLTGEVPLTPVQKWFFSKNWSNIHHVNQSALFDIREQITFQMIKSIFNVIAQYHDVFRMRYRFENERYSQFYTTELFIDVEEKEIFPEKIPEDATRVQGSLNIFDGPLVRVVLYRCRGSNDRLLVVAHHLVVDGVSWRILIDDIETLYKAFFAGGKITLPAKTYSYRQWAYAQERYALSEEARREEEFWHKINQSGNKVFLEPDFVGDYGGSCDSLSISLNATDTKELIQGLTKVYDAQINDILLTALTLAVGDFTEKYELSFTLEGHGREDVIGLDVSRTIGWFTSIFPVFLKITNPKNLVESVREIKNSLRMIPNKGIGYGIIKYCTKSLNESLPRMSFNYLGQWDVGMSNDGVFGYAKESSGEDVDPKNGSYNLISMNGWVKEAVFEMCFSYNKTFYRKETIEKFAGCFEKRLRYMINK